VEKVPGYMFSLSKKYKIKEPAKIERYSLKSGNSKPFFLDNDLVS